MNLKNQLLMQSKEEIVKLLQGKWKLDGGPLTFKIENEEVVHVANAPVLPDEFELHYVEQIDKWRIQALGFGWLNTFISEINEFYFVVCDYKDYGPAIKFDKETNQFVNPESVYKFYRAK